MVTRIVLIVALVLLLVLGVGATLAQEITETPTAEPTPVVTETVAPPPVVTPDPPNEPLPGEDEPITTPGDLFEQLVKLLGGTYIAWAAAGVIILTGIFKTVLYGVFKVSITGTAAGALALVFQVAIWLLYWIASTAGRGEEFKQWYLAVIDLARSFLPLLGSIFVAHVGYEKLYNNGVPVVGYKPPRPPKVNMIRQ